MYAEGDVDLPIKDDGPSAQLQHLRDCIPSMITKLAKRKESDENLVELDMGLVQHTFQS